MLQRVTVLVLWSIYNHVKLVHPLHRFKHPVLFNCTFQEGDPVVFMFVRLLCACVCVLSSAFCLGLLGSKSLAINIGLQRIISVSSPAGAADVSLYI